ncbi:MAG: hypothetical protein ACYTX0_62505, partial [Nostoc sp.]
EREWAELPSITFEPEAEEVTLGERSKGFGNTKKSPKKNVNSTVNATTPSNTSESPIPVSTVEVSTASLVG